MQQQLLTCLLECVKEFQRCSKCTYLIVVSVTSAVSGHVEHFVHDWFFDISDMLYSMLLSNKAAKRSKACSYHPVCVRPLIACPSSWLDTGFEQTDRDCGEC